MLDAFVRDLGFFHGRGFVRKIFNVVLGLLFIFASSISSSNLTLGFYNLNANGSVWRPTFEDFLGTALRQKYDIDLIFENFYNQQDIVSAVQNQEVDLVLVNPGLMVCFFTMFDVDLIAGLINNVSGYATTSYGGDILVLANSTIETISDLKSKRIIAGPPYSTGVFQLQAKYLHDNGFDIFVDPEIIAFEANQSQILAATIEGHFDAAFFRADQVTSNLNLIISSHSEASYPFQVTTNLYAEWCLGALPQVEEDIKSYISNTLFDLPYKHPATVAAKYTGWTTPYNYYPYVQMLTDIGVMNSMGECIFPSPDNYYDFVSCPAASFKVSLRDVNAHCSHNTLQCSTRACVCAPCYKPNNKLLFGLTPIPAWGVTFGIAISIILISWSAQASYGNHYMIPEVSMQSLIFPEHPEFVCQSRYAPIVKASMSNTSSDGLCSVYIHSLLPTQSSIFLDSVDRSDPQVLVSRNWSKREIWKRAADSCSFRHPHLVHAHGIMKQDGELWLIIDCNDTGTLYDFIHNQTVKPDMGEILRLLKEIALALQFLHSQDPAVTLRVTPYNVMLDRDRGARLMLSDNFYPLNTTCSADIYCFGNLMLHLMKGLFPDEEPHGLQRKLQDPLLLIRDCSSVHAVARPDINDVLKRLSQCILLWNAGEARHALARETYLQTQTDLIHSMLPEHVAARLRQGLTVEPQHHACVSILFTDIVGFTNIASKLEPVKVADMLDRLYRQFDNLIRKFDLFKVETIGDSLLVAGNLHKSQPNHMARMVTFAENLVKTAQKTSVDLHNPGEKLNIRVGINAGPVVASVVGNLNPRYCLFGNAVNLASRMESSSIAGRIQLSNQAADLLLIQASHATCRRLIQRIDKPDIKGIGHLSTFWLTLEDS